MITGILTVAGILSGGAILGGAGVYAGTRLTKGTVLATQERILELEGKLAKSEDKKSSLAYQLRNTESRLRSLETNKVSLGTRGTQNIDLEEVNELLSEILEINFRNNVLTSSAQSILLVLNKFYQVDYITIFINSTSIGSEEVVNELGQLRVIASNAGNNHLKELEKYVNAISTRMTGVTSKVQASEGKALSYPTANERGVHFSSFTLLTYESKFIGGILLENRQSKDFINGTNRQILYDKVISKTSLVLQNVINTENLINMTSTDQLTNIHNRRFIDMTLPEQLTLHGNLGLTLSVAILDIDHFKKFNDTYGHQYGDLVLQEVAYYLKTQMSQRDNRWVARYGGEEFVLFFGRSNPREVEAELEELREGLANLVLDDGNVQTSVTASFGVCHYPYINANATVLIQKADQALYQSKATGRNRVTVYNDSMVNLATDK